MLDEIGAHFAVIKSLSQAAESVVDIGEYRAIALLDNELVEESEAARKRIKINVISFQPFLK